jgi:hypothetical protein
MYETVQTCNHCGANLTLDDMRRTDCPYCRTVYPHHSQAAQHAAVVNQVMGQMMGQQAQVQDAWRGSFGVPPQGPPMGPPPGMGPPGMMGPPGPMGPMGYGNPYVHPHQVMQAHMNASARAAGRIGLIITLAVTGIMLLVGVMVAVIMMRAF